MKLSSVCMLIVLTSCFFATPAQADETITDKSTGFSFPKDVTFESGGKQYQLEATGVATRKKLIIKVYSIASYLQKGAAAAGGDRFEKIMSDDNAKQLTMRYARDISINQIQDAFQDSFKKVFPGQEYTQMQGDISNFVQFFNQAVRKGDEYVLRWLPGGVVEVLLNGKKVGSINSSAFARGLWKVWFSPNGIVDRNDLVSSYVNSYAFDCVKASRLNLNEIGVVFFNRPLA